MSSRPNEGLAVELKEVSRVYPGAPPVRALTEASLTVSRGEYVAIVGPSGSGKSTLLNLLGLLDRPSSGAYRLGGLDVSGLCERERAAVRGHRIGFVFQSFHLLEHRDAIENVMLGALYRSDKVGRADLRDKAVKLLASIGLSGRAHALPSQMSGGERQRVAIARALMNSPELLLCDEPTGNLDSSNTRNVLRLMKEVHESGQTLLVITHDQRVAEEADRMVVISDGRLTEAHA